MLKDQGNMKGKECWVPVLSAWDFILSTRLIYTNIQCLALFAFEDGKMSG